MRAIYPFDTINWNLQEIH